MPAPRPISRGRSKAPAGLDAPVARDVPRSLATLHLAMGALALARAELEELYTSGGLDLAGMADLAEARWRMGDLEGAAEAAADHLAGGTQRPIAHVVGAEAAAAWGHEAEARAHVIAVSDLSAADLDELFAGMPRHAFWPATPAAAARLGTPAEERTQEPSEEEPKVAALVDQARDDLSSLDRDRIEAGLTRLALALRLDPTLAPPIVELLAARPEAAALVTHGDALRILGRALGAEASYRAAAAALERSGRRDRRGP